VSVANHATCKFGSQMATECHRYYH